MAKGVIAILVILVIFLFLMIGLPWLFTIVAGDPSHPHH
jgi:hypothetical protein